MWTNCARLTIANGPEGNGWLTGPPPGLRDGMPFELPASDHGPSSGLRGNRTSRIEEISRAPGGKTQGATAQRREPARDRAAVTGAHTRAVKEWENGEWTVSICGRFASLRDSVP